MRMAHNLVCIALGLSFAHCAHAESQEPDFSSRPLRMLVGYGPASGADVVARLIGESLQESFKKGVVVENKSGAGGALAVQDVARATPDGYTLLLAAMPQMTILPFINKVSYDVKRDLVPVSQVVGTDLVLVANPQRAPTDSMQTFVAWAKKQPLLFFGTPGAGSVGHFGAYFFANAVGAKVEPIHFRTTGEQITALVNGDINAEFFSYAAALPLVQAGKLKALITTSPTRSAMFPDTPTSIEAGYPKMQFSSWYGVFAPAGTPPAVVRQISKAIVRATQSTETRHKLEAAGLRVTGTTEQQFAHVLDEDIARWGQAVKASNFKP